MMKKLIALLSACAVLTCCSGMIASAEAIETFLGFIVEGESAELVEIRDQLAENVAADYDHDYDDEDGHAVNVVAGAVRYFYLYDEELEEAKQYCIDNGIDLNLVDFRYLGHIEWDEVVSYEADDIKTEADPDETVSNVKEEESSLLTDIRDQLRENIAAHYPDDTDHQVEVADGLVHYLSYDDAELDEAKQYCIDNGIDLDLLFFHYMPKSEYNPKQRMQCNLLDFGDECDVCMDGFWEMNAIASKISAGITGEYLNGGVTEMLICPDVVQIWSNYPEELEEAKQFCIDNDIDLELVEFYYYEFGENTVELRRELDTRSHLLCENSDLHLNPVQPVVMKGDASGDNEINVLDVIAINRAVLGKATLDDDQNQAADVDGNGIVDAADSLMVLKYLVGLIESL